MNTLAEFLDMGGYAFYVWGAYLTVLVVLVLNLWLPFLKLRQLRRKLFRQIRFQQVGTDRQVPN